MSELGELLSRNFAWAEKIKSRTPNFFKNLSKRHKPKYLWIGCSDSRTAPDRLLDLPSEEIFVHRNIANMVHSDDASCMSVIQYAVDHLRVDHIVVCGHSCCGGVRAVLEDQTSGPIDQWLRPLSVLKTSISGRLQQASVDERSLALAELNVVKQVTNVCGSTTVKTAWEQGEKLSVHGWLFDIRTGILKDLLGEINSAEMAASIQKQYF